MDTLSISKREYSKESTSVLIGKFLVDFFTHMQERRDTHTLIITRKEANLPLFYGKVKGKFGYMVLHLHDKPVDENDAEIRLIRINRGKQDHEYSSWQWYASFVKKTIVKKPDKRTPEWQRWNKYMVKSTMVNTTRVYLHMIPMPVVEKDSFFTCLETLIEQLSQNQYKKLVKWMLRYEKHPASNIIKTWSRLNNIIQFEAEIEDIESDRFVSPIRVVRNSELADYLPFLPQKYRIQTGQW